MITRSKFIVVEHDAKKARLHWDLRFKMPKSKNWMSFAVRKGIPLKPGQKVLAVRTHDHTEKEALFLGVIKDGYGAGRLKKWDDGQVLIHKFKPGHILLEFKGRKVKGYYHLINTGVTKRNQKFKQQQYFLFKGKTLNEWIGVMTRLPPDVRDDVEEDNGESTPKLHWNKRSVRQ